jgi:hypothetical protein
MIEVEKDFQWRRLAQNPSFFQLFLYLSSTRIAFVSIYSE